MKLRHPLFAAGLSLITLLSAHDGTETDHAIAPGVAAEESIAFTADGTFKFSTDPGWGALPNGENPGPTHGGVARDKAGNAYVSTDTDKGILVFNSDGTFKASIAKEFKAIHGLHIREEKGEEFLYAAWLGGGQALKLKLDGTAVLKISCPMESTKYKNAGEWKPTSVDSAPDGSIFVADGYGKSFIHKFDASGKYVMSFGGKGNDNNTFQTCHGIGVDLRGEKPLLFVCDRENRRAMHFDLDGKYVATLAKDLRRPCSVAFEGKMAVIAELEARVTLLDGENKEVAHLGDNPNKAQWANFGVPPNEWSPLFFTAPHGACFDGQGGVYVQDWNKTGRIRHLKPVK
jgi:DNA-binding beta-propeller fold protein YncE